MIIFWSVGGVRIWIMGSNIVMGGADVHLWIMTSYLASLKLMAFQHQKEEEEIKLMAFQYQMLFVYI